MEVGLVAHPVAVEPQVRHHLDRPLLADVLGTVDRRVLHRRAHDVVQRQPAVVGPELVGHERQVVPLGEPGGEEGADRRPALERPAGDVVEDGVGRHQRLRRVRVARAPTGEQLLGDLDPGVAHRLRSIRPLSSRPDGDGPYVDACPVTSRPSSISPSPTRGRSTRSSSTSCESVFAKDATADLHGVHCDGQDAIIARIERPISRLDATQHLVGNHQVHVDGDTATHRCYLQSQHVKRGTPGGDNFLIGGTYEDRLARTPEGWRITHRTMTPGLDRRQPGRHRALATGACPALARDRQLR